MVTQPAKTQNRIFLLIGTVLAAVVAVSIFLVLSHSGGTGGPTQGVVVATGPILAGDAITANDVQLVTVPANTAATDVYTDTKQVLGKVAPVDIAQNQQLTSDMFASGLPAGGAGGTAVEPAIANQIVKGYVAVTLPANLTGAPGDQMSVGYYIRTGDHIDILVDPGKANDPSVRYGFQDVPVLRVGIEGTAAGAVPSVYVVELPRDQAEALTALVTGKGPAGASIVRYVVRPRSEWGKIKPDLSAYTPNYENSNAAPLPPVTDSGYDAQSLSKYFGQ